MKAHATTTKADRIRAFEEVRQEIQGKRPRGPYEGVDAAAAAASDDAIVVARFKAALRRDKRYGAAGPVYLRLFGLSQSLRSIYDGGRQLIEGGGK